MSAAPFRRVQHYYVGAAQARGSFCTIYEAFRKEDGRPCAIRLISHRKLSQSPQSSSILFNESVLVKFLSHSNICPIFEIFESSTQIFQVMPWFNRGDLQSYVSRNRISRVGILSLFDELLAAVEYLHSLHIAHLDLKPENVLVSDSGHVKLTDFSFAAFTFEPVRGGVCGSVGYVAPEVLTEECFGGKEADVFSLGVCLYFMFKRKVPAQDTRRVRPAKVDYGGIDGDVAELIAGMLGPADLRPSIRDIRSHPVFTECGNRQPGYHTLDVSGPLCNVSESVVRRLSDTLERSPEWLKEKLLERKGNREKVLYLLAEDSADFSVVEKVETETWPTMAKSLPETNLLSSECRLVQRIPQSRAVVVNAIVKYLLAQRYLVSRAGNGLREFVLNKDGEDICVDVEVRETGDKASCLVIREKDASGAGDQILEFVDRQFRLAQE
jgi:serine/threonine protein kinase